MAEIAIIYPPPPPPPHTTFSEKPKCIMCWTATHSLRVKTHLWIIAGNDLNTNIIGMNGRVMHEAFDMFLNCPIHTTNRDMFGVG